MKSFAEFLPTMTAREREIVEAFHLATEAWHEDDNPKSDWPIELMRQTPPAKQPESVESCVERVTGYSDHMEIRLQVVSPFKVKENDILRITKIEGDGR